MGRNAEKTKFSIRVDTELLRLADTVVQNKVVRSRTELIEDAIRFYLGYLTAQNAEDYLLQSLSSVVGGTVKDTENRLARMDFKLAVELSKLSQIIAYTHDVEEAVFLSSRILVVEESPITHLRSIDVPAEYPRSRDELRKPEILSLKEELIGMLRKETS